jgi:hypothetical protein
MTFRWSYVIAAAALVVYLLVSGGAPLGPVLLGCAVAALAAWWRRPRPNRWDS